MRGVRYLPGAAEGDLHHSLLFLSYPCSSDGLWEEEEGLKLPHSQQIEFLYSVIFAIKSQRAVLEITQTWGGGGELPLRIMIIIMHTSNQDIKRWRERGLSGFNL